MKSKLATLEERVIALQAELEAALHETAIEQHERCRRGGPQGEASVPLQYFQQQVYNQGYGPCKCQSYLRTRE